LENAEKITTFPLFARGNLEKLLEDAWHEKEETCYSVEKKWHGKGRSVLLGRNE